MDEIDMSYRTNCGHLGLFDYPFTQEVGKINALVVDLVNLVDNLLSNIDIISITVLHATVYYSSRVVLPVKTELFLKGPV